LQGLQASLEQEKAQRARLIDSHFGDLDQRIGEYQQANEQRFRVRDRVLPQAGADYFDSTLSLSLA